ncbi:uncharacterized protein LOC122466140 [Chelonia mydas]|uniref:uncharacterized protein LOC122466140 n=1 Tax=Chelonia mydas TaxID=8469 RepID=UPI001CA8B89B|nr:uncharacterized protein LOC122466140 [Chelonia mydas]
MEMEGLLPAAPSPGSGLGMVSSLHLGCCFQGSSQYKTQPQSCQPLERLRGTHGSRPAAAQAEMRFLVCVSLLQLPLPGSCLGRGRCLKRVGEFSVLQQPPRAVKEAGASVEMNCTLALPPGHPRPSSVLVTWHRGQRGDGLRGTGKLSEVEELRGRVETAWLESISASTLHIHSLQPNDSAVYLCLLLVFPSAQPCALEGTGTRLTVTGFSAQGNRTQISSAHRELPEHHWTIRLLALGAGIVLTAAVVRCLPRRRGGERQEQNPSCSYRCEAATRSVPGQGISLRFPSSHTSGRDPRMKLEKPFHRPGLRRTTRANSCTAASSEHARVAVDRARESEHLPAQLLPPPPSCQQQRALLCKLPFSRASDCSRILYRGAGRGYGTTLLPLAARLPSAREDGGEASPFRSCSSADSPCGTHLTDLLWALGNLRHSHRGQRLPATLLPRSAASAPASWGETTATAENGSLMALNRVRFGPGFIFCKLYNKLCIFNSGHQTNTFDFNSQFSTMPGCSHSYKSHQ